MGDITKNYIINTSSNNVFKALTEIEAISEWSGDDAEMNLEPNGTFSLWGGSIHGINVKISQDQIIQKWKEDSWEEFSTVTFNLKTRGKQTEVELIHQRIPDQSVKSIDNGWDEYYMLPLKEFVEQ